MMYFASKFQENQHNQSINDYLVYTRFDRFFNPISSPLVGKSIHLKSRNGTYKVVSVDRISMTITCNRWKQQVTYGSRKSENEIVPLSDFNCFYKLNFM